MPDQTPIYGLRFQELNDPPDGASLGEDLANDVEDELARIDSNVSSNDSDIASLNSRVTTNENDIVELKKGWNFIASGVETSDFNMDLTAGGTFPAGTFNMIRVFMHPRLDTGNSWIVGTINNLTGASDYNRGWYGQSFDTATTRNASNTSDRAVFGYVSAQQGHTLEALFMQTDTATEIPMSSESRRGAPDGFDGNREWMLCNNSMNSSVLLESIQWFATAGVIASAVWFAEGFRI